MTGGRSCLRLGVEGFNDSRVDIFHWPMAVCRLPVVVAVDR